jgi:hypothetical protein
VAIYVYNRVQQFLHCCISTLFTDGNTILAWLRSCCLATRGFAEPFPSNRYLCWFHNSSFQQTCHNINERSMSIFVRCSIRISAETPTILKFSWFSLVPLGNTKRVFLLEGRGGPYGSETPRLPHFLEIWLVDGADVSFTRRPPFTLRKFPGTHFC